MTRDLIGFCRSCIVRLPFLFVFLTTGIAIFVFTPAVFATTKVTETISTDATWVLAGSPYYLPNGASIDVLTGATLTIEPGVVVKFGDDSSLNIDGILNAFGSSNAPIIFTSLFDDVGGDTNGDGGATFPSSFDLWWLNFYGLNGSPTSTLRYATIRNVQYGPYVSGAALSLEHFTFEQNDSGFYLDSASALEISDSTLGGTYGDMISADGGSTITVERSTIHDVFSGDVFGLYNGSTLLLSGSRIENIGNGSAIGLYSAHATTTESIISGGLDSALEPYDGSSLTVIDSTVEDFASTGVYPYESRVLIQDSIIRGNDYGVYASGAGSDVRIINSVIADNVSYGVYDDDGSPTDARGNFWGDATGPFHPSLNPSGFGDTVSDNVDFSLWLSSDPLATVECCSSVAFIPGLEASRLYKQGVLFEDKLWEPNNNHDVEELALSPTTGESVDQNIYTRDVLDEPLGLPIAGNIYKTFLERMNGLVSDGLISAFEPLPYDWRFDVRRVATSSIALENGGSYRMIPRIEALADASKTGKVTLITHSNGGLVAKELLDELARLGKAGLIDRVIMVAAPELGTPAAAMELLHGTAFTIGFPSREATRELGENMKSAYALLPSREYFTRLGAPFIRPLIEFSTTTSVTRGFRDIYGDAISDYDSLRRFLLGENGSRSEPAALDVDVPNVLKSNFLSNAEEYHGAADAWTPPSGIEVIEVVGWGLATPYGIKYDAARKRICNENNSACVMTDVLDPEPLDTFEGDATVVAPSAEALGGERYYVDINRYNKSFGGLTINREHKNILEIEPLQDLITTLVKHESTSTLPAFISPTKPEITEEDKRLRLSVHSPVSLHLSDSINRHTGPVPNTNPDSDFELYEEQIPNSYYWRLGEGQYAGAGGDATTTATLYGLELGAFTLDIEELAGGKVATTTVFEDIPVATTTVATLVAGSGILPVLSLDIDGDGSADVEITPGGLTAEELVGIVKGLIRTLDLPPKKEKELLKRMDKLEKELSKERKKERLEKMKTRQAFAKVIRLISLYGKKKLLTAEEATELITMLENIRRMVVI